MRIYYEFVFDGDHAFGKNADGTYGMGVATGGSFDITADGREVTLSEALDIAQEQAQEILARGFIQTVPDEALGLSRHLVPLARLKFVRLHGELPPSHEEQA